MRLVQENDSEWKRVRNFGRITIVVYCRVGRMYVFCITTLFKRSCASIDSEFISVLRPNYVVDNCRWDRSEMGTVPWGGGRFARWDGIIDTRRKSWSLRLARRVYITNSLVEMCENRNISWSRDNPFFYFLFFFIIFVNLPDKCKSYR
jgi:hypothetical protein